jgi:hypothetical protein
VKILVAGMGALVVAALAVLALGAVALTAVLPNVRQPGHASSGRGVPTPLAPLYRAASATYCPALGWTLLAAQGSVESGYRADASSPAGAQGIAQFMPGTWAQWGIDGDADGVIDVMNPADAIPSQARYDCALLAAVVPIPGDPVELMLAAYNAGLGRVRQYRGVPPYAETRAYIAAVLAAVAQIDARAQEA